MRGIVVTALLLLAASAATAQTQTGWFPFTIDQDGLTGAVDFSHLNRPLTAAGRISVKDGHFVNAKGGRVRFWGVNFAFGANFPEQKDAVRLAKRLRRLGVNLVRLHHMDTSPDTDPAVCRSILTTGPYPTFNPIAMARLRAFLDALKAEGIYVNLNLHVGYQFRPDVDKVPGPAPLPTQSKPLHIFYPRMVELQCDFAKKLIEGLRLKNDPVLAMVEIDNEASLLFSHQARQLDKVVVGEYREEFERQKAAFLGGMTETEGRLIEFLVDRDRAYLNRIRDVVRLTASKTVPIAGTQVEFGGPLTFDSHDGLDYHDDHFYIDHYNFPNQRWDGRDWRIRDSSGAASGYLVYLHKAFARQAGKPYTVSEFNEAYPNRQGAELDPTFAAFAALQDWDGLMHFAYEHGRDWDRKGPSGFNLNGDVTKLAAFAQAGWMYRTAAIEPARHGLKIGMPKAMRIKATAERQQFALAKFFEANGVNPNVAFQHRVAIDTTAAGPSAIAAPLPPYRADTGELTYDGKRQLFIISAAKAAGVFGFARNEPVQAGPFELTLDAPARGFVALLATSLDGKPLASSERMLITNPGATRGATDFVPYPGTADWWTLAPEPGSNKPSGPYSMPQAVPLMERNDATLTLRGTAKNLTVYPLDGKGKRGTGVAAVKTATGFRLRLASETPWYEVAVK
jgi:hypothetical protein